VYQSLSGLADTVKAELALNAFGSSADVNYLSAQVGLTEIYGQGCFELSGGQQAILAVAASAILRPRVLSLDCCLEQVDNSRRELLLRSILDFNKETALVVADNEMEDLPVPDAMLRLTHEQPDAKDRFFQMSAAKCNHSLPPRMGGPRLHLKGIHFAYRSSSPVLCGLDVELEPGRVYWLRGANGSGKSTIAKLLAGVLAPQKGEIVADGKQIRPTEFPGALVSYHFQNPDFQLFSTTVWGETLAGPKAIGCPEVEAANRSRHVLTQMAIPDDLLGKHPLDLPFTLRKRVAVAAAISSGAPWLVLDEPSLGQDSRNTSAIAALIQGLARAGTGVILISHSARLTRAADRILMLNDGVCTLAPTSSHANC
jgi:energy-coupling factor transporter ATP-binding protein EcfA2